jgi:hypothetical protein
MDREYSSSCTIDSMVDPSSVVNWVVGAAAAAALAAPATTGWDGADAMSSLLPVFSSRRFSFRGEFVATCTKSNHTHHDDRSPHNRTFATTSYNPKSPPLPPPLVTDLGVVTAE